MWPFSSSENKNLVESVELSLEKISPGKDAEKMPSIETEVDQKAIESVKDDEVVNGTGFISGQTFDSIKGGHSELVDLLQNNYLGGKNGGSVNGGNIESIVLNQISGGLDILKNDQSNLQNQLKQTLQNLLALKEFIKKAYTKLVNLGYECDNDMLKDRISSVKEVHDIIMEENDRQINILTNLLNISVEPTSKSISELINKYKDFTKVQDLLADYEYGTSEASDRLALVFSGVTQAGLLKDKVKKALEQVKMSEVEFKKTKNMGELRAILFKKLKDLSTKKIEGEEVNDLFSAIKVLEGNIINKDVLDKPTTFGGMLQSAAATLGETYVLGGSPSRPVINKNSSLQQRVKRKQKTTKEIVKSFINDVNLRFNEIKQSVDEVSSHIGNEVSYDDNIKNFIVTYTPIGNLTNEDVYFALLEFDEKSTAYKNKKTEYLDTLHLIMSSLEPLIKGPKGSYFNNIKQNIIALIEVIDTYTNVFKGFKKSNVTGGKNYCSTKQDKKLYKTQMANSIYNVKETSDKLTFYGKIASIRENLKCSATEHKKNQEGYKELLGKALGEELSKLNKRYKHSVKIVNESNKTDHEKNDLNNSLKLKKDSITGLYQAVEAVDLYLVNFTDAIAQNPAAVNELEKILQSTQMIAMWFVEKSGDNFNNLFTTEYTTYDDIYNGTKKAVESISVLKNILSMFINIGEKFGSVKLQDKLHMSANEIYKRLVKYIWVSAVNIKEIEVDMKNDIDDSVKKGGALVVTLKNITNIESDETNEYFKMCIKSIIAKIFTVIGTYSIFRNPESRKNMITNPVRLILGGDDNTPDINDNAMELYIRLPLLVEFYKEIFDGGNREFKDGSWNNSDKPSEDTDMIAYIPELGSLWSGLIKIIFDKSKYIDKGIYSNQNMKDIVREINIIYNHYSSHGKEKVVRESFCGLINEINRRYGIMKRCDVNNYYQTMKRQKNITINDASIQTNFDILDEENNRNNPGPSALYTEEYNKNIDNENYSNTTPSDKKLVEQFRQNISDNLQDNDLANVSQYSFEQRIKFYKEELKRTHTNEAKFNLVIKAIEQSNDTSTNNTESLIVFHEMIMMPINVLNATYDICTQFISNVSDPTNHPSNGNNSQEKMNNLLNIIEYLYLFTCDLNGLVSTKFVSNNKIILLYNKLQDNVESSISNIRYMISKFRNSMDLNLIEKADKEIQELEDQFLNHILKNEAKGEIVSDDTDNNYNKPTFDDLTSFLNDLLKNIDYQEDSILYKKIMWNNNSTETQDIHKEEKNGILDDTFKTFNSKSKSWDKININLSNHYSLEYYSNDFGIVARFNQILYNYLNAFYNKSTKKIYVNLFNKLATETFSNVVYGKGVNNTVFDNTVLPLDNIVLTGELGHAMKTLLTRSINPQLQNKYHAITVLNDVSPHMLEKYKVNLPAFIKLFELLIKKCIFYKQILENNITTNVSQNSAIPLINNTIQIASDNIGQHSATDEFGNVLDIFQGYNLTSQTADERSNNYKQLLNNVINGCQSIITDAQTVLDDVNSINGKSNLYFELKNDFIKDFYKITSEIPFMPLSSVLYTLNNNALSDLLLPLQQVQTDKFKFMYGTTSIFNSNDNLGLNIMPYMKELLTAYNNSMQPGNQIDIKKADDLIKQSVSLLKLSTDIYYYRNNLSHLSISKPYNLNLAVISTNNSLNNIINLTENTFVSNNKEKFYELISNKHVYYGNAPITVDKDRKNARLVNIIDMNIIPINIHSLMREIPLVNIYNYSISYDKIIDRELSTAHGASLLFSELLKNPYIHTDNHPFIETVMNDNITDLHLFKPRFLSDQLWTKLDLKNNESRFNTKIIRDITWIVNLQRMLRRKIRNEITEIKSKVVKDYKITSRQLTDYDGEHAEINEDEFVFKWEN